MQPLTSCRSPASSGYFIPGSSEEQRSTSTEESSLAVAWRDCGSTLRRVVLFTGMMCIVGFFHPGLAPLIAAQELGTDPMDLGLFTSVLALGSIAGGIDSSTQ